MKSQVNNNKEIRKTKYKYSWYKSMIRMLRNKKWTNYRDDKTIHLT